MKNIHLIPTDNYAPLVFSTSTYGGLFLSQYYSPMKKMGDSYQNLYITSNEEIKEGVNQWYLDKNTNKPYNSGGAQYSSKQDVIILTTDQDLINDGIHAIDDDFLQFFVKNPSCKSVDVFSSKWYLAGEQKEYLKIIIPKEETKQETLEEAAEEYVQDFDLSFYDTVEEIPVK
jgi:hypothetical protein